MLTPAQQAALQASILAAPNGGAPAPTGVATNPLPTPTPGEVFPSVTTSMPIAAGQTSSRKEEVESEEARKARLQADEAARAAVEASRAAALGTSDPSVKPTIAIEQTPQVAPTGEGYGGGIREAATLVEQKQINDLAIAAAEKEFQDKKQAGTIQLAQEKQAREAALNASVEQARKDKAAAEAAPVFEKNGWGWDFARALAAGAGAYGAAITHSPNFAQEILDKQIDRAVAEKKEKIQIAVSQMEKMGVQQEQIDRWHDRKLTQFIGEQQAKLDRVKSGAGVLLARFPQEQQKAFEMIADKQAKLDAEVAKRAENVGKVTRESGQNLPASVVQTVQPGADKGQQAQRETVNELVASKQQAQLLREFEGIVKKNPKAWAVYRDANKELAESENLRNATGGKLTDFARGVGAAPLSLDERLEGTKADPKTIADAKRINQIWPIIQTGEARILDPVGVLNESSQEQARKHLNMYTMKPEEAVRLSQQFRSQHEERAGLLESTGGIAKAQAAQARQAQAPRPSAGPPTTGAELGQRLGRLPTGDQQKAVQALRMPKSDPRFKDADAWLKRRGLR